MKSKSLEINGRTYTVFEDGKILGPSMNRYVKQAYGLDDFRSVTGVQCSELIEKYKALDEK